MRPERIAREVQEYSREQGELMDESIREEIGTSVEINQVDRAAFIEASAPIYEEFGTQVEGGKEIVDKAVSLGEGS